MAALPPTPVDGVDAALGQSRSDQSADERLPGARRQPAAPRHEVPDHSRGESGTYDLVGRRRGHAHDSADRVCNRGAEEQRTEQTERRRQNDGLRWSRCPGRHKRCNRICRVVNAVSDRESDREYNGDHECGVHELTLRPTTLGASAAPPTGRSPVASIRLGPAHRHRARWRRLRGNPPDGSPKVGLPGRRSTRSLLSWASCAGGSPHSGAASRSGSR
jgi:hypothetical protein